MADQRLRDVSTRPPLTCTRFGHRNVQGLALRRAARCARWSTTDRDDEVNLLYNGGDYGWNPVPGYNESVPMTDQGLPGHQIEREVESGYPTVATSGGTFVSGKKWGSLDGALAVAHFKASGCLFLTFDGRQVHPASGSRRR